MSTVELKTNIHKIVDKIQSEQLLMTIYDFLKTRESNQPGKLWKSLSEKQKSAVMLAFEESEDENNLVERAKVVKRIL